MLPISGISFLVNTCLGVTAGLQLLFLYRAERVLMHKYLAWYFLTFSVFMFSMAWPHIFWQKPDLFAYWLNYSQFAGFIFLHISYILMALVAFLIRFAKAKWPIMIFLILSGLASMWFFSLNLGNPFIDFGTGLTVFDNAALGGIFVFLSSLMSRGLLALVFALEIFKPKTTVLGYNAPYFAIGALLMLIGGPIHTLTHQIYVFFISDIITLVGIFMLWAGAFMAKRGNSL